MDCHVKQMIVYEEKHVKYQQCATTMYKYLSCMTQNSQDSAMDSNEDLYITLNRSTKITESDVLS